MSPTHSEELVLRMTTRGGETVVLDLNRVANSLGAIQAKSAAVIATAQRMTNMVGMAAGTLTAVFGGFAIAATKAWGALEEGSLRLESFIGDAEKARKTYAKLLDFAAETPFRLDEEVLPGATALLQFDMAVVDTSEDLEVLTDRLNILLTAARGSRRDIYDVVNTLNRLRQGMWVGRELAPLGITPAKLQALGVQMKKGGIGVLEGQGEAAYTAALKILEDKWRIFAERQDSLITNRFKKIGDRLRVVLREAGEPLSEVVMPVVENILTKITALRDRMREIYADPEAREKFKNAFKPMLELFDSLIDKVNDFITTLTEDPDKLGERLKYWTTLTSNLIKLWIALQITIWIAQLLRAGVAIFGVTMKLVAMDAAAKAAWLSVGGPILMIIGLLASVALAVKGITDAMAYLEAESKDFVLVKAAGGGYILVPRAQAQAEAGRQEERADEIRSKTSGKVFDFETGRWVDRSTVDMQIKADQASAEYRAKGGEPTESGAAVLAKAIELLGTNVLRESGGKVFADKVCAWGISGILISAGFPIKQTASSSDLANQLEAIGATQVSAADALPGDIAFRKGPKYGTGYEHSMVYGGKIGGKGYGYGEPGTSGVFEEQPIGAGAEYWRLPGPTMLAQMDAAKTAKEQLDEKFAFAREALKLEILKEEYDNDAIAIIRLQLEAVDEEIEYAKELNDAEAVLLDLHIQKAELLKNARGAVQDRIDKENQELQDLNEEHTAQAQKELDGLRMRWAKEDETLRMKQEHELRMAELADIEWDETKSLELQLKQVQEQAAILRQRRTEREAQLAMGGAHIWDIISDADLAQITEALKVLGLVGEELAAAIARIAELAQKTLEEKWRAAGEAFGRAIASGAIGTAIDQSFTILQNIIAARIAKMTAGGAFGEGLGGQFLGGLVGGLAGGIIGFAATALGKVFKKGKKGGMLVEQADTWVMRAEDPNKIRALPSSYFYSGRAMGNLPTFSKSTSFFEQTIGGQAEAQVVGLIQQQKRRGRNWI